MIEPSRLTRWQPTLIVGCSGVTCAFPVGLFLWRKAYSAPVRVSRPHNAGAKNQSTDPRHIADTTPLPNAVCVSSCLPSTQMVHVIVIVVVAST